VRRFVRRNLAMVQRGAAFKQLSSAEKRHIIERARELLSSRRIRLHELSQIVAGEMGRAVETVRYTLRRHDREHPQQAMFGRSEQPLVSPEHQALYDGYVAGEPIETLAVRSGLAQSAAEQIIRECRARHVLARPLQCVFSHEFDAPNADALIMTDCGDDDDEPTDVSAVASGVPLDLPPYLRDLYREPLLTAKRERCLFRQYNYLKFKAGRLRSRIDPLRVAEKPLRMVEELLAAADEVRGRIVRANLRLVVSIARRHVGHALARAEFFEIISDGNMSLLRAVEIFDYTRGYKFSTYASWAIMRNYARTIPETLYHGGRQLTSNDELLETLPDTHEPAQDAVERENLRGTLDRGLAQLSERERTIIMRHFGLTGDEQPETLDEIGKHYGVTKERIRQIERKAMRKLKEILSEQEAAVGLNTG
jgi:RNA polymerase sigma factor (sigma-70 family)